MAHLSPADIHLAQTQSTTIDPASATIQRESARGILPGNTSFLRSIRFRLTAWFAFMLILILIAFGIALRMLLVRSLENDINQRLLNSALQIQSQTRIARDFGPDSSPLVSPSFDDLVLSGTWAAMLSMDPFGYITDPEPTIPEPLTTLQSIEYADAVTRNRPEVQTTTVLGKPARVLIAPFDPLGTGGVSAIVVVGQSDESLQKTISLLNQILVVAGGLGVLAATWTGWIVGGRALEPIGRIIRTADQIALDQNNVTLSKRLPVSEAEDELSQLAVTFNNMLARLEAAFNAQQRFVADASHELRTPLTAMRGNVDVLLRQLKSGRELPAGDIRDALSEVQHESERMGRLIQDLLMLARTDAYGLNSAVASMPISLDVVAREAFRTGQALSTGQEMHLEIAEPITVMGDADRLVQIIIILLENGIRHTPRHGSITLSVDRVAATDEEPGCARIIVQDTGEGIPPEHLPHLFERFYRVEGARTRSGGGTGLGLSIALSIVREHHGWIDVESGIGQGTSFTIWIPLPDESRVQIASEVGRLASRIQRLGRNRDVTPHPPAGNA